MFCCGALKEHLAKAGVKSNSKLNACCNFLQDIAVTLLVGFRHRREDDCLDCVKTYTSSDLPLETVRAMELCQAKNVIVCRSCEVQNLKNVSVHTFVRGFEAWCFDSADFTNKVRLAGILTSSQAVYMPLLSLLSPADQSVLDNISWLLVSLSSAKWLTWHDLSALDPILIQLNSIVYLFKLSLKQSLLQLDLGYQSWQFYGGLSDCFGRFIRITVASAGRSQKPDLKVSVVCKSCECASHNPSWVPFLEEDPAFELWS